MSTDDPTGYITQWILPPHELRALGGSLVDPPATPLMASPGLATAAASPAEFAAPTLPPDDPAAIALAIARIAGEPFPMSVVPFAMPSPQLIASPGIAPQLAPSGATVPRDPIAPELAAAPSQDAPPPVWNIGPSQLGAPQPAASRFGASQPAAASPPASNPTASNPTASNPTASNPTASNRSTSLPSTSLPSTSLPSTSLPSTSLPSTSLPSTSLLDTSLPEGSVPEASLPFAAVTDLGSFEPFGWEARVPFGANEEAVIAQLPPVGGVGAGVPTSIPLIESAEPAMVRSGGGTAFDPYIVRRDFPILEERVHGGKRLVWLDNAATTQKPRAVIDRLTYYYEHENSNVHRAAHALAARATDAYESARETTRKFLGASSPSEIVFVRGATEGINLIAKAWGQRYIERGDEIVLTNLEHHANIVPWQQLCAATGARLRVAPVDDRGDVILEEYERLLCSRTKLVTFTQVSNAIGTITPAREMIESAHRWGATVLLDGAQAVSHMAVDVQALDCDFYVFSGHKVFAPTGIGAVYGKRAILDAMPPWQGGGNMISDVTFERTLYQDPPWRFEAGTGNIADAAGLGAALDYVMRLGLPAIDRYEHELLAYATEQLATVPGLHMVGAPREKAGVLSFILDGKRTEDVGGELDKEGIAVRSGHHCAQPILRRYGLESSVRASLAFYNVREDIDALVGALKRLQAASV